MFNLETAWKYVLNGRGNGSKLKTASQYPWEIEKITWPDSLLTSEVYDNTDGTINLKQIQTSNILNVLDEDHPEIEDGNSDFIYAIAENVTKGFFFRIHHSNYPNYNGEMYVMNIEDDNFLYDSKNTLQSRYDSIYLSDDGTGNPIKLVFDIDDEIKIYPYKIVQSDRESTEMYQSYLFGHPNDWPQSIKDNGAKLTRPIFASQTNNKQYRLQTPNDVETTSTGYKYFVLPQYPEYILSLVLNNVMRYGGTVYNPGDHNVENGYSNSNHYTEHRINNVPDNSWFIITAVMTPAVFANKSMRDYSTGFNSKSTILEDKVYITGENDFYSGARFLADVLKRPQLIEGTFNPENMSQVVLEKYMQNAYIEGLEYSTTPIIGVSLADSNIAPKSTPRDNTKLRCYTYLTKDNKNYYVNIDYQELIPDNGEGISNITDLPLDTETDFLTGVPYRFVGLDNDLLNGLVFMRTADILGYTNTASTFDGYFLIDDILYSSGGAESGWQLFTLNGMESWGVDGNYMPIWHNYRVNSFRNKNGKLAYKGSLSVKLPFASIG